MPLTGVAYALIAALLFGVTTPLAKNLLQDMTPVMVAGLFYLGSGLGLAIYLLLPLKTSRSAQHTALKRSDWLWLSAAILSGGAVAPVLLMLGLAETQAATASLFLNLEGVFTAIIAWMVFKENCDHHIVLGMLAIIAGGVLLSVNLNETVTVSNGALLIAGACLAWAIDNNLTRKVAGANPAHIACLKGSVAGMANVSLALLTGASLPPAALISKALVLGFLGYGVSLTLFVLALRHLGTARTGAYFSLAPFAGAVVAIAFLHESITPQFAWAAAFMAIGLWLHLAEKHEHEHEHKQGDQVIKHTHPHFPDLQHNHKHK
ncbi:MAG: DMT family transporter [Cyanobacteria bacterium SZAS LIN-2]|nr:DMT family transporter [Cyanobacteria bacterium SZAS LIN-2]